MDSFKHNVFANFSTEQTEKKEKPRTFFFFVEKEELLQEIWLKAE